MRIDSPIMSNAVATGSFTGSFIGAIEAESLGGAGFTSFSSSIANDIVNLQAFSSSLDGTFATDSDLSNISASLASDISTNDSRLDSLESNTLISGSIQVDHDATTNFVANEHIDHSSVTLTAGNGLTGGGDITADRTFTVGAGDGIAVNESDVQVDGTVLRTTGNNVVTGSIQIDHDDTTNFVADEHIDHTTVSIIAGDGLTGGGDITTDRTLNIGAGTGVTVNANDIAIGQDVATTANVTFATASITQNLTVGGDLIVQGTRTELQVTELNVEDLNITVASGAADSAAANGAGITIGGANQSLQWEHSTSQFVFDAQVSSSIGFKGDGSQLTGLSADSVEFANILNKPTLVSGSEQIDHDSTTGFESNEHINHSAVTLTAGAGLTGGGDITDSRSFEVGAGDGITVNADDIAVDATVLRTTGGDIVSSSAQIDHDQTTNFDSNEHFLQSEITEVGTVTSGNVTAILPTGTVSGSEQIDHDQTTNFVADEHIDHSSVTLTAGDGLTGGGDITTNRSFAVDATVLRTTGGNIVSSSAQIDHDQTTNYDANEHFTQAQITTVGTVTSGDVAAILPAGTVSGSVQISHDSTTGFVSNEHIDHSSVTLTAGDGLTGGGDITTNRSFAVGAGDGITVNANDIAVDATVLRTTGDSVISSSAQVDHDQTTNYNANEHFTQAQITTVGTVTSGDVSAILPSGTISGSVQVSHDSTTGYVANEHIDHSTVSITAGAGLTGGGTIAASRTLNIGAGTGVTVNADDIAIGQDVATTANVTFGSVSVTNDVTISGNLSVLGDATQLQVSALNVEDINITVASGAADSAAANGAGLTIAGANESLTWDHGNSRFNFSDDLNVVGNITLTGTVDGVDISSLNSTVSSIDTSIPAIIDSSGTPAFNTGITKAEVLSILNVEDGADVTDTANVTAAGALMDSEVDADIKTLSLPANTTISTFGASLIDDADASTARSTLGVDAAGTDNSTDVTLAGSLDYITISGQQITRNAINVDTDLNITPTAIGKAVFTGSNAAAIRSTIGVDAAGTDNSTDVTLTGAYDYITIVGQTITRNQITNDDLAGSIANAKLANSSITINGSAVSLGGTRTLVTDDIAEDGSPVNLWYTDSRVKTKLNSDNVVSGSATQVRTFLNVENGADVTDTANVTAAGALMDSEVDADLKTFSLPANTTISTFGASLVDDADAAAARTTLGLGSIATLSSIDISSHTNLTQGTGITLTGDTLSTNDGQIVHDNLSGFVADEHIAHSTVSINAGSGLTGGGSIAASRTLNVGEGTGITVSADAISTNDSEIVHDNLSGFVANEHINHTSVTLTAGSGLTGGGTIAASRTFNVGQGDGISVSADAVAVDSTVARKNINNNWSADQTFGNIQVNGTGSFAYIQSVTGSAKLIGDAYIVVNTDTPAERYAGMKVYDSGSTATTASLEFDSSTNDWFYQYSDDGGATAEHGVVIFGPEYGTKGSPTYLTNNTVPKSEGGGHHITDSNITDSGTLITLGSNSQVNGTLNVTGDVVAYYSSDKELKDNVTPIDNALEKVNALGGYEFDWNDKQEVYQGHDIGVIAQEVEAILPELVTTREDGYKAVKYEKLTAVLIQAVKELSTRVKELENK